MLLQFYCSIYVWAGGASEGEDKLTHLSRLPHVGYIQTRTLTFTAKLNHPRKVQDKTSLF